MCSVVTSLQTAVFAPAKGKKLKKPLQLKIINGYSYKSEVINFDENSVRAHEMLYQMCKA